MSTYIIYIAILLVIISIIIGTVIYVKKIIEKTDPNSQDESISNEIDTAQDFIPIRDIKDDVLDLGGHRYRAIIEMNSINYHLKTDLETDMIEQSFANIISSISYPVTFHIQTREIDNTLVVRELENDYEVVKQKQPQLASYAKSYLDSMKEFNNYLDSVKQKKKYIIVPFEEAYSLTTLNDEEKYEYSLKQLNDRVEFIRNQFLSIGIKSKRLENEELVDVFYRAYHREESSYDISESIANGDYFTPVVSGPSKQAERTVSEELDLNLTLVQNLIRDKYLDPQLNVSKSDYEKAKKAYTGLEKIRKGLNKDYQKNYSIKPYVDNSNLDYDFNSQHNVENVDRLNNPKLDKSLNTTKEDEILFDMNYDNNFNYNSEESSYVSFDFNEDYSSSLNDNSKNEVREFEGNFSKSDDISFDLDIDSCFNNDDSEKINSNLNHNDSEIDEIIFDDMPSNNNRIDELFYFDE